MQMFNDPDLGQILVKPHARAKRVIARQKENFIQLTVPEYFRAKDLPPVWAELKPKLLQMKKPLSRKFSDGDTFRTFSLQATIVSSPMIIDKFHLSIKENRLLLLVPEDADFGSFVTQKKIQALLLSALRWEAQKILPAKTGVFAQKHGLRYSQVKISSAATRWGSCSGKRVINLSLYLMLLPERLIDYVILHELAHTVEMNHGSGFWKLLDKLCDGNSKLLRAELRNFDSELFKTLSQ